MKKGVHGEKLIATRNSDKLPKSDIERLDKAIKIYEKWVNDLFAVEDADISIIIHKMVKLLNQYKNYIDLELIFDSPNDFLYRQKGQLKLDNTVLEEFLPILVEKCLKTKDSRFSGNINSQTSIYSSIYFESSLNTPGIGGGMLIKTKNHDFSVSRELYIKSSYMKNFNESETKTLCTNLGYILAEIKTNLDKTMFQEASATAHDVKLAVTGAKYFLLCDFLDMTPINTSTTDIDEILILRKAKRISSNVRAKFDTVDGRKLERSNYQEYLEKNPYAADIFERLVNHIIIQTTGEKLVEQDVLSKGYF
ncbi:MAG: Bpu10I family restriction endonuclease [Endomicrobium sp.]|jgi:hypothetical protein|nr:Bpu10I family restriction endonuclease [Endomicrobium sp.]